MAQRQFYHPAPLASGIVASVHATDDVAPPDRIAYWRDLHRGVADVLIDGDGATPLFDARLESWRIGPFVLVDARSAGLTLRRRPGRGIGAGPDQWSIRVSLDRPWRTRLGDETFLVDVGAPFLQRVGALAEADLPAGRWRVLLIADDAFPELSAGLGRLRAGPQRGPAAALLTVLLTALPDQLRAAAAADAPAISEALRAICSGCLLGGAPGLSSPPEDVSLVKREQVLHLIRAHIGSARLDVDMIARLAGMSRSSLYRLFERTGGIARVVRDLRLRMVTEALSDPRRAGEPISTIAECAGFHCPASFSRVFREAYGCSPGAARAAALAASRRGAAPPGFCAAASPSG